MNFQTIEKKVYDLFWKKIPEFFNNMFEVSYTKTSKIIGSVLCLAALMLTILRIDTFLSLPVNSRWLLMALDLALPFIIGFAVIYTIRLKSEKANRVISFIILLLMPIALMSITECLNNVFIYDMTYLGFLANYIVILVAYFVFFAISGSFKVSYLIVNTVLVGLAAGYLIKRVKF